MRRSITFGSWEGKPLEWLVVAEDSDSLTLWCKSIVKNMAFGESRTVYYAESDVRKFLSGEFYEKAFSDEERERILPTELDNTEYQTYAGAVGIGAAAYSRESLTEHVYLFSIREMMKTYALTEEEIYRAGGTALWSRSPETSWNVSTVNCSEKILRGESPYTYESRSHDYTTDTFWTAQYPNSNFPDRINGVVPAMRIKK